MNWIEKWYLKRKINQWKEVIMLSGYKTYIVGICSILYGVTGFLLGKHDYDMMVQLIAFGLGMMGLRAGVSKVGK